ncbi:response regulator transcription factor [Carboxylicivirga linearis]|uniref:Response regulator transcription factor n=1 Tax=Carboxylicivirga linearis TaxID=1628157 RepID=A0ABS5JV60_9BACT|nr:response regulator transcription factor [Carboxylicivirga linearis]MBS2098364.1 response regulator transcription factor [Carboxylicivirga linearis]
MARILLVEDDTSMGFLLVDFLETNGFDVKLYKEGIKGLEAFEKHTFDFCILDVMLPGMDGFTIAENIRKVNKRIPIIFLTARAMKEDKIKGFNLGVDDYVTKPFDEDELLLRIKAILNRIQLKEEDLTTEFSIGKYHFDSANQMLTLDDDAKRLTQKESDVLKMLCQSMNNIVRREDILVAIWGENDYFHGRSLDVFIAKLRKYLKNDESVNIENVPKVGFVLNTD